MKINNIRDTIDSTTNSIISHSSNATSDPETTSRHLFSEFQPLSVADTKLLVVSAPNKTCNSDPVPTHLIKSLKKIIQIAISNLTFLCKLTEKAAAKQVADHITTHHLFLKTQSAYRRHHSTETALLKVKNDILLNMNQQHLTLLVLLDLSSAFDTVDHIILLTRLQSHFGICGSPLSWFESYLSNRTQSLSSI